MSERILNVKVGESLESSLARAAQTMEAVGRGESPTPYFDVGFFWWIAPCLIPSCTYTVHVHRPPEKIMTAAAIERIVVQATSQEKKAISAKAKRLGCHR